MGDPIRAKVRNWSDMQHYKDRAPPWIKLHKRLLDDFDFACLPLASRALAPCIWLLASEESDGCVRIDTDFLHFRLRWPKDELEKGVKGLIDKGFLIVASETLAECKQEARLETETEREKETEVEKESPRERRPKQKRPSAPQTAVDVPDWIDGDAWAGFAEMRKASRFPLTKRAAESIIAKLDDFRRQGQDPADVLDQSTRSGWRDVYPLKKDRVNGHGGETLEERIRRVSEDFAQGAPDA